jgi:hypothetical protein
MLEFMYSLVFSKRGERFFFEFICTLSDPKSLLTPLKKGGGF